MQSGSGGIITGDRLRQRLGAHDGARARVRGQGAVSVHREGPHAGSSEDVELVADGFSVLENLAEPRILFRGSRFEQRCVIRIDAGVVISVDAVIASEPDAEYRSLIEIRDTTDRLPSGVRAFAVVVGAGLVHDPADWAPWHDDTASRDVYGAASALPFRAGTAARIAARDGRSLRRAIAAALPILARQRASWTSSN